MALSYIEYTQASPSNADYAFTFPYIAEEDIKVAVGGVEVPFTFLNANTISITTIPAIGEFIRIFRDTEKVDRLVDFQDGSVLSESNLDLSAIQVTYIAQEAFDRAAESVGRSGASWDGQDKKGTNYADPTDPQDLTTKAWVEAYSASYIANAASSATASASSATASASSATASASSAAQSQTAQTASEVARDASQAALDEFTDLYLGAKTSNPTVDNDGAALQGGAIYYSTSNSTVYFYDLGTTSWVAFAPISKALVDALGVNAATLGGLASSAFQAYDPATAKTNVAQSFTAEQTFKELKTTQYSLTGTVIDPANGSLQYKTLGANTTFTENLVDGQSVTLRINDGTAYTITWPTITWKDATAPTLPTTGYAEINLEQMNGVVYGVHVGDF